MIEAGPAVHFEEATTTELRRKLLMYKRQFNPLTGDYLGPEHKTESHAADAFRYVGVAVEQSFNKQTGELLYSPAESIETDYYEEESMITSQFYQPRL